MNQSKVPTQPATKQRHLRASDMQAAALLATQAVHGVTRMTEGVHRAVLDTMGLAGQHPHKTGGLTGQIYGAVHGINRLVGAGTQSVLNRLLPLVARANPAEPESAPREAVLAAINGVLGDQLAASSNPLATHMSLRHAGKALDLAHPPADCKPRVVLMIHGLCMNDLQWNTHPQTTPSEGPDAPRLNVNHGLAVADALDATLLQLRYNTGRHVSENAAELNDLLNDLLSQWPVALKSLTAVVHSMGGLLIRSSCQLAEHNAQAAAKPMKSLWRKHLKTIVFLGTPHHGAPLEKAGNWVDVLLAATPYSKPFARLGQLRSAGITDLRFGLVQNADWHGQDRFAPGQDPRTPLPLPSGVACYTIAATTAAQKSPLSERIVGDGLVPLASALGQHRKPEHRLAFAKSNQWIAYNTNHMQLLSSEAVTRQVLAWLVPGGAAAP